MKINYYKTKTDNLAKAFCSLIEKCYYDDARVLVIAASDEYATTLDRVLWSYSKKHFIPHATLRDPQPELQPVLIITQDDLQSNDQDIVLNSPNKAAIILTVNVDIQVIEVCLNRCLDIAVKDEAVGSQNSSVSIEKVIIVEDEVKNSDINKLEKAILEKHITDKGDSKLSFEKFQQQNKGDWQKLS